MCDKVTWGRVRPILEIYITERKLKETAGGGAGCQTRLKVVRFACSCGLYNNTLTAGHIREW